MRVVAGVILIIAAVLNLFASLGYVGIGAATSSVSEVVSYAEQQNGTEMTAQDKVTIGNVKSQTNEMGFGLMAYGAFLLISVGILITGAVFLFQNKKPKFILIAGGIAILAEVIGMLLVGFGVMNILGLVSGVLAIVAAISMGVGSAPEPAGSE